MDKKRGNGIVAIIMIAVLTWTSLPGVTLAATLDPAEGLNWTQELGSDDTISVAKDGALYKAVFRIQNQFNELLYPISGSKDAAFQINNVEYGVNSYTTPSSKFYSQVYVSNCNSRTISGNYVKSIGSAKLVGQDTYNAVYYYDIVLFTNGRSIDIKYIYEENGEEKYYYDERYAYGEQHSVLSSEDMDVPVEEGDTFIGWSNKKGGSVLYKPGDSIDKPVDSCCEETDGVLFIKLFAVIKKKEAPKPAVIAKAIGTATMTMDDYFVGNTSTQPAISSTTNEVAKATVTYKLASSPDSAYTTARPGAPGDYVARVVLPENDNYTAVTVTDAFHVDYLPFPTERASVDGDKGNVGEKDMQWYTSKARAVAPSGYKIGRSLNGKFSDTFDLEEGKNSYSLYYMNAKGEKTTLESKDFWMDSTLPEFKGIALTEKDLVLGSTSDYAYFGEKFLVIAEDSYLSKVSVNKTPLEPETTYVPVGTEKAYAVVTGKKMEQYEIEIEDEAGNVTKQTIQAGPAWLKTGIIPKGDVFLEEKTQYTLGSGNWTVEGDRCTYSGGKQVFASSQGDYVFSTQ